MDFYDNVDFAAMSFKCVYPPTFDNLVIEDTPRLTLVELLKQLNYMLETKTTLSDSVKNEADVRYYIAVINSELNFRDRVRITR